MGRKIRLWEIPETDFFCGMILHPNEQLSSLRIVGTIEEVFTTLIGFCARQTHSWKFNLTGLMDLLFLIRYRPQEHEKECTIWKEVVIDASRETLL